MFRTAGSRTCFLEGIVSFSFEKRERELELEWAAKRQKLEEPGEQVSNLSFEGNENKAKNWNSSWKFRTNWRVCIFIEFSKYKADTTLFKTKKNLNFTLDCLPSIFCIMFLNMFFRLLHTVEVLDSDYISRIYHIHIASVPPFLQFKGYFSACMVALDVQPAWTWRFMANNVRVFLILIWNKTTTVLDCLEVFVNRPSNLLARAQSLSSCKRHNTNERQ